MKNGKIYYIDNLRVLLIILVYKLLIVGPLAVVFSFLVGAVLVRIPVVKNII
jgi:hypothetical protein